MKGEVPISKHSEANALVEKAGRRIAGVAKLPNGAKNSECTFLFSTWRRSSAR